MSIRGKEGRHVKNGHDYQEKERAVCKKERTRLRRGWEKEGRYVKNGHDIIRKRRGGL